MHGFVDHTVGFTQNVDRLIGQSSDISNARVHHRHLCKPLCAFQNRMLPARANPTMLIKLDSTLDGLHHDSLNVDGKLIADGTIDFKVINGSF